MANFPGLVLTDHGRRLQTKAQIGAALTFTRVALGDGTSSNLEAMTALAAERLSLSIQDFEVVGDGTSRMRVIMTNENVSNGFFVRELGVFARDPDTNEEKLYSYTNAGEQPDFLPAGGGATLVENVFDLYTVVGNAQNVTAVINDYITIATKQDIDKIRPMLLPLGGTAHQLARKRSNDDGDVEWFDPAEGVNIAVDSREERRVAVADQRSFRLATVTTRGLAVYLNGQRLPRSAWEPLGETQVRFTEALSAGDEVLFVRNEETGEMELARVSLSGPNLVYPDSSNTFTITDFDSFADYEVTASRGSVSRSGDTITLSLEAEETDSALDLNVTRDGAGITYAIAVGAQTIARPQLVYPGAGGAEISLQPTLQATAFKTYPSGADSHQSSDWQIAEDADFAVVVWEALGDVTNLTSVTVPDALPINTQLYARHRQAGVALGVTEWSAVVGFKTTNTAAQPVITSPADGATEVSFSNGLTITASAFNFPGGGDTHIASDWQLRHAVTQELIASSTNDGANLTTWALSGHALPALEELETRTRYKGQQTGYTPWSAWSTFTTGEPVGEVTFATPGTYAWVVPGGVTQISGVAVGGGGNGGSGGGGGGALRYGSFAVVPGQTLQIVVGGAGNSSSVSTEFSAGGGTSAGMDSHPSGGVGFGGEGGGNGGRGGRHNAGNGSGGGGGGAGGYSGTGGDGGNGSAGSGGSGSGGAAGGGGAGNTGGGGGGGGGVGIYGAGESGAAASGGNDSMNYGRPGSSGEAGKASYLTGTYRSGGDGGKYGGGGAGWGFSQHTSAGQGAIGAVRLIWGPGRSFPDNAA